MSSLYGMQYAGQTGQGGGCVYVGNGKILGMDAGGGRYAGTYTEQNGQLSLTVTLTMIANGTLVTGQPAPKGTTLQLTGVWPQNFANGQPQAILVAGKPVQVILEKIGDI